jgi:mono/diheme cytochrome c family protein
MTKTLGSTLVPAAMVSLACIMTFSQSAFAQSSGEATYKAKCQSCHGATGTPNPGIAKLMGVKPASDPAMRALTLDQIEAVVKNGKGKMKPMAGLTDAQVKDVAAYFKTLK